jgi:branched-chain amino acid transport system substrate-binding protein
MRRQASIALVASLLLGVAACAGTSDGGSTERPTEVKIAGLWPLSGSNATQGTDVLHGAELAVEIVNGEYPLDLPLAKEAGLPGLGGAKLKLVTGDTQGKPEVGASEVDRLVNIEKVVAVVGCYNSGVTLTASQRAERLEVPFVNGESSSTALTERGLKWFFRTGPSDKTFASTMFDYIEAQKKKGNQVQTIGVLHTNDQYGNDGAEVTKKIAAERGLELVADVPFDPTTAEISSQITQVRAKNPDVLFVLALTDGAIKIMKTMQQLAYYPPALLAYGAGFSDPAFIKGAGDAADAASTRAAWAADIAEKNLVAKTVSEMFQNKFNAPMTENSARSFTAIMALARAINNAKSTDPEKVRTALTELNIPKNELIMPWDGIKFDSTGQNTLARGVVQQLFGDKYKVIFPEDAAVSAAVWPMRKTS